MSNLAENTHPINPARLRVELSHRRELLLDLEPGKADHWRIALVRDHGTHKMCSGAFGGLSHGEALELLMAFQSLAGQVDRGGLPVE
jgi:hypothetical protein